LSVNVVDGTDVVKRQLSVHGSVNSLGKRMTDAWDKQNKTILIRWIHSRTRISKTLYKVNKYHS